MHSSPAIATADLLSSFTGDPGDLDASLHHIATSARIACGADVAAIISVNPIRRSFRLPGIVNSGDDLLPAAVLEQLRDRADARCEQALQHGELHRFAESAEEGQIPEGFSSMSLTPLRTPHDGKTYAVLRLLYRAPQSFTPERQSRLSAFVAQAAAFLRNTWLLRRYRRVSDIGHEINQELTAPDALFRRLAARAGTILDISCFFMLVAYESQTDTIDMYYRDRGNDGQLLDQALADGGCAWVIRNRRELIIDHYAAESGRLPVALGSMPNVQTTDPQSLIFLPLLFRDQTLGVLSLQHDQPHAFDAEDVQLLRLLASHAALALRNIQLFDNLQRVNAVGQSLPSMLDHSQALDRITEEIRVAAKADIVTLIPYQPATGLLELPPHTSGVLTDPAALPSLTQPGSITLLAFQKDEAVFARDASQLYGLLGGDPQKRPGRFEEREGIRSAAAIPLRVGDDKIGVLFINFRRVQRFDKSRKLLIQKLADAAAVNIRNSREFKQLTERRIEELRLLREVDRRIAGHFDLKDILDPIVKFARQRVPAADRATVFLPDEQRRALVAAYRDFGVNPGSDIISLNVERGLTRWAFLNGNVVNCGNVHADPQWRDLYIEVTPDVRSELDMPLAEGEQALGVLCLQSALENAFSDDDVQFLRTLAGQAVVAIKNSKAFERDWGAVLEIGDTLISEVEPKRVFETILARALKITGAPYAQVWTYDPAHDDLYMQAQEGLPPDKRGLRIPRHKGLIGYVQRTREFLNVNVCQSPWDKIYEKLIPDVCWELAAPLIEREGDHPLGVINIESVSQPFSERDARLIRALATLAVVAIRNAKNYAQIESRRQLLDALHQVDLDIIGHLDNPDQVVRRILNSAAELTGGERAELYLFGGNRVAATYELQTTGAAIFHKRGMSEQLQDAMTQGIVWRVAQERRPYRTQGDAQEDPHYVGDSDIHSEVAVPLISHAGQCVGVINVESTKLDAFNESHEYVLNLLAGQAVIAFEFAREYTRFKLLAEAGERLSAVTDLAQAYATVTDIAHRQSQTQVVIRRLADDGEQLEIVSLIEEHPVRPTSKIKVGEGVDGYVAATREEVVILDMSHPPVGIIPLAMLNQHPIICFPIQLGKDRELFGTLRLIHNVADYLREADLELYRSLAQQLATTIHRLNIIAARQDAEQRALQDKIFGELGRKEYQLAHKLEKLLGLVKPYTNAVIRELDALKIRSSSIEKAIADTVEVTRQALDLSEAMRDDLVRIQKEYSLERIVTSAQDLIEGALQDSSKLLESKHARVDCTDVAPDLWVHVARDEIVDALNNVISNAADAIPASGHIVIRASLKGRRVRIEVQDDGPGIGDDLLPNSLFELGKTTKPGSAGYGLYRAREYVRRNGGELSALNLPNGGACFILTLPHVVPAEEEHGQSH